MEKKDPYAKEYHYNDPYLGGKYESAYNKYDLVFKEEQYFRMQEEQMLRERESELNKLQTDAQMKKMLESVAPIKLSIEEKGAVAKSVATTTGVFHRITGEKMPEQKTGTIGDLIRDKLGGKLDDKDVNSPHNVKRKQLAEKIINLFKSNGYVFGGYLRDEVAGVPFVDLDMYFPIQDLGYNFKSDYSVVQDLNRAGCTIVDLGETEVYIEDPEAKDENGMPKKQVWRGKMKARKFEVEDKMSGVTIRFDMVSNTSGVRRNDDHPFVAGLDADVNCLWRDKSGRLQVARNLQNKFAVEGVKKNITDRIFVAMEGEVREDRITKLTAKGYKAAKGSKVTKKVTKKESKVMSKDGQTFSEQFKDEVVQAAYQAAGKEVSKGVKAGLIAAAKAHGADDGALAGLTKLLDSEAGEAAISAMLGHGLPYAPMIGENEHVQILAEKMRVNGYAQGMSIMFGLMMTFIMPSISKSLEGLETQLATAKSMGKALGTGKSKVRVAADKDADAEEEAEAEHETAAPARKAKSA